MLFKASATSKRKENSPRTSLPFDPPLLKLLCSFSFPHPGSGILTGFPVPQRLDPPLPYRSKRVAITGLSKEVFLGGQDRLTPVQVLFTGKPTPHRSSAFSHRIIATTTKICTGCTIHADLHPTLRLVPHAPPTQLWCESTSVQLAYHGWMRLSIVHFRGWYIRQVSCYTLLSRFQLPWPRPCCLDAPTPFLGSD